ncbi:MAG: porin family protein [Gemmatimonadota bacterium]|jgi:hypothetical protein
MRRLAAIALALVLVVGAPRAGAAQSAFGFKAGVSRTGLTGPDAGTATARDRFVGGIFFGTAMSSHLALQLEVLYAHEGADNFVNPEDATGAPVTLSMAYIQLPILLRAGFPTKTMLFSVYAGPVLSFRNDCEIQPAAGPLTSCGAAGAPQGFVPRATDVAAAGGAGIDFALGGSTFFVDARYTVGMLSIEAGSAGMHARHVMTSLMAGLAFPIGR